jgi:hypothetical protein
MATETSTQPKSQLEENRTEPIPIHDQLVLWMFVVGILMFVGLLLGDMFINFLQ